jgi:Fe-S cluster assembly ATP-binding protein
LSGRVVESAGPELALDLEKRGYDWIRAKHGEAVTGKD